MEWPYIEIEENYNSVYGLELYKDGESIKLRIKPGIEIEDIIEKKTKILDKYEKERESIIKSAKKKVNI